MVVPVRGARPMRPPSRGRARHRTGAGSVNPEPLLTARQVADVLGLSPATILDRFQRGELPGFRVGGRVGDPVRFRWSELEAWLEAGRVGPALVAVDADPQVGA
jgi:excisionase family DNA binding protein